MINKLARFKVSHELMRELLCLPENAQILHCMTIDPLSSEIFVECEDFPVVESGSIIPLITPVFNRDEKVVLKDWGFKKD